MKIQFIVSVLCAAFVSPAFAVDEPRYHINASQAALQFCQNHQFEETSNAMMGGKEALKLGLQYRLNAFLLSTYGQDISLNNLEISFAPLPFFMGAGYETKFTDAPDPMNPARRYPYSFFFQGMDAKTLLQADKQTRLVSDSGIKATAQFSNGETVSVYLVEEWVDADRDSQYTELTSEINYAMLACVFESADRVLQDRKVTCHTQFQFGPYYDDGDRHGDFRNYRWYVNPVADENRESFRNRMNEYFVDDFTGNALTRGLFFVSGQGYLNAYTSILESPL